jgi:hypothetical protein
MSEFIVADVLADENVAANGHLIPHIFQGRSEPK